MSDRNPPITARWHDVEGHTYGGCDWWILIRHVDNTYDWWKFWKRFRQCFVFQSRENGGNGGNLTAKRKTLWQKEKTHDKKNNLRTKRITSTSRQKKKELKTLKCPLGIEEILPPVFFFLPWGFLFAVCLILFAVRFFFLSWGYSNSFAVTVVGHHTKASQTTSNWIVRILYEATWL